MVKNGFVLHHYQNLAEHRYMSSEDDRKSRRVGIMQADQAVTSDVWTVRALCGHCYLHTQLQQRCLYNVLTLLRCK